MPARHDSILVDARQLTLFDMQPLTEAELNARTPLRETWSLFQAHLFKQGKTTHTVDAFTADLHLLGEYSGEREPIKSITTRKLNSFLEWMEKGRGIPCSRKTYARRVTTLKVFFKWLHEIGALAQDPAAALLQRSGPAPLALILTDEEVEAALSATDKLRRMEKPDTRPALLFHLLLQTGMKKGEVARMKPDDIDTRNSAAPVLLVRQTSIKHQYKERRLLLEPLFLSLLDDYEAQYKPQTLVFTCTPRNLEYILEAIGDEAGIEKKLSFEMLRWTFAVRAYKLGMDANAVREALGLSKISWVETFAKIKQLAENSTED